MLKGSNKGTTYSQIHITYHIRKHSKNEIAKKTNYHPHLKKKEIETNIQKIRFHLR